MCWELDSAQKVRQVIRQSGGMGCQTTCDSCLVARAKGGKSKLPDTGKMVGRSQGQDSDAGGESKGKGPDAWSSYHSLIGQHGTCVFPAHCQNK